MLIDKIDSNLGDIINMNKDRSLDIDNSWYRQFQYIKKIISFSNFKKPQTHTMHKLCPVILVGYSYSIDVIKQSTWLQMESKLKLFLNVRKQFGIYDFMNDPHLLWPFHQMLMCYAQTSSRISDILYRLVK